MMSYWLVMALAKLSRTSRRDLSRRKRPIASLRVKIRADLAAVHGAAAFVGLNLLRRRQEERVRRAVYQT